MRTEEVVFPIPISEDRVVTINNLPVELSREDANKIARVVQALSDTCEHGEGLSDYCEPCGRIHSA